MDTGTRCPSCGLNWIAENQTPQGTVYICLVCAAAKSAAINFYQFHPRHDVAAIVMNQRQGDPIPGLDPGSDDGGNQGAPANP